MQCAPLTPLAEALTKNSFFCNLYVPEVETLKKDTGNWKERKLTNDVHLCCKGEKKSLKGKSFLKHILRYIDK